ncbi:MAG: carboxymuconolactone decarboxylase family protein [Acidobacteriota bacterium]
MPFLSSLPENAAVPDLFAAYPATSRPLMAYHQQLLRGPSPLTTSEREMIAAFVSGLNNCAYCHGVHSATAEALGVAPGLLGALLADIDTAAVDERLRPILHYVRKLTLTPARVARIDADAVFAAGWSEKALHDAVSVCAMFNFMNRLVNGLGIEAGADYFRRAAERLATDGYEASPPPGGPGRHPASG